MHKKGKFNQTFKKRYFELFPNGELVYYTNDKKQTRKRKGVADLSTIIGFHIVDNKTFEVITPQRIWCFHCKFKSERDDWIASMKSMELCHLHHDAECPAECDYLSLSANGSILKLIQRWAPPEGETILYSDRVLMTAGKQQRAQTTLMLTTAAIYHFRANSANLYKKCDRRILWRHITHCTVSNPKQVVLSDIDVMYIMLPSSDRSGSETESLRALLDTMSKSVGPNLEVRFERKQDEPLFAGRRRGSCRLSTTIYSGGEINDTLRATSSSHPSPHWPSSPDDHESHSLEPEPAQLPVNELKLEPPVPSPSPSPLLIPVKDSRNKPLIRDRAKSEDTKSDDSGRGLSMEDFTKLAVIGRGSFGKILKVKWKVSRYEAIVAAVSVFGWNEGFASYLAMEIWSFLPKFNVEKDRNEVFAMKILKKREMIRLKQVRNIKLEREVLKRYDGSYGLKLTSYY